MSPMESVTMDYNLISVKKLTVFDTVSCPANIIVLYHK